MYLWCPGHHGRGRLHLLEKEKVILLINHQVLLLKETFYCKEWQPFVKSEGIVERAPVFFTEWLPGQSYFLSDAGWMV